MEGEDGERPADEEVPTKRQKTDHEGAEEACSAASGGGERNGRNREGVNCLRARNKLYAVERDYTHHYVVGVNNEPGSDQFIFQHFNKLCLVGLAPSHACMARGRKIVGVDFEVGRSGDKSGKTGSGKNKIGAVWLTEDSRLCDVVCDDGTRYKIRSCIKGHLTQINERLREEPSLLQTKTQTEGFIAIITPKKSEEDKVCASFLSEEQYSVSC